MGIYVLPRKVFDPKGLLVKYSRISTYTTPIATVPLALLASGDVASYVSTREAGAIRVHDSIVRLLRVWSKGCSSQPNELGCGKLQHCGFRISSSSASLGQLRNFLYYGVGIALVLGNFRGEGIDVSEVDACFLQHGVAQHFY